MNRHDRIDADVISTTALSLLVLGLLAWVVFRQPPAVHDKTAAVVLRPEPRPDLQVEPKLPKAMVVSWYGDPYHGRTTASGEVFDKNAMTAAHRWLPFGTTLRLAVAGKHCYVRVNDRGPQSKYRDLDISEAAAKQLGMTEAGVCIVYVTKMRMPK